MFTPVANYQKPATYSPTSIDYVGYVNLRILYCAMGDYSTVCAFAPLLKAHNCGCSGAQARKAKKGQPVYTTIYVILRLRCFTKDLVPEWAADTTGVENKYERVAGAGDFGGQCTCPDGQTYVPCR